MKILLVFPPMLGEERYGKLARAGSYLPPLGLLYLAAVLEKRHEVRIVDGSVSDITVEDIRAEISSWRPDIVGISAYTPTLYRALAIAKIVKETDPRILTVLGGPHPTACPEETVGDANVDVVVSGEGEITLEELADAASASADISAVKGIFYKRDGKILRTPQREGLSKLDELPMPARHLVDMTLYKPSVMHYKRLPAFSIMCGRGCPFKCTYCSCSKVFKKGVSLRSPENIIAEIKHLVDKYGAREIMAWDDVFGLSKKWTLEFCERIKPLGLTWSAWMRVDLADQEVLRKMAESGCWHISYGVESGNQKVLDTIKKGITIEQIMNAFKWTHQSGMEARGTYIFGLPNETRQTMEDTINISIKSGADYAQFQLLTPYPGTELWDEAGKYGEFAIKDFSKYTIWFPVFVPKGLTQEDLLKAHRSAYRRFYFRAGYIWQSLKKLRDWSNVKRTLTGILSLAEYFFK
jgi:anaerobic magnesium-protoporphyrin IX monomethyl ester cyclase